MTFAKKAERTYLEDYIIPLWDGVAVRVGVPYGHDMAEEYF
jgi:hypothetical protein